MGYKEEALEFLGIKRWHELGYKGKGIKFMSDERVTESKHPDVNAPSGYSDKNSHGNDVMNHIKLVAPEGEFISYPLAGVFTGETYTSKCTDYIIENKVHVFTTSETGSYPNKAKQNAIQDCIKAGCIFFGCAGNEDDDGIRDEIKYEGFYAIGGVKPTYKNNKYAWEDIKKTRTSSYGEELDFVTLAEILGCAGTSFCSPIFAGMVGLAQQFFEEETGRRLTREEMELFIKDNCFDVEQEGFDIRTGYGIFILPEPSTINIKRYVAEYKEIPLAEMQIGNNTIKINGKPHVYDFAPRIIDDRTHVPIRFLEDLGYKITWIEETQEIILD